MLRHRCLFTAAVCVALLGLSGCVSIPNTYAPPTQRQPITGFEPGSLRPFIRMNEPGAEAHLLNDIRGLEAGSFRWTRQQPTLQFQVTSTRNQRLKFDFALNSNVLAKTGPITVSYFVNGNLLERVTYTKDGEQHYEKRVPARFLSTDSPVIVSAELDKVMETPDGGKLGLVLTGAGFVE